MGTYGLFDAVPVRKVFKTNCEYAPVIEIYK